MSCRLVCIDLMKSARWINNLRYDRFWWSSIHGHVKIANLVNTLIPALYDKHILLFTVGLHPIDATYFKHICVDNFNYLVQQYGDFFQLRWCDKP